LVLYIHNKFNGTSSLQPTGKAKDNVYKNGYEKKNRRHARRPNDTPFPMIFIFLVPSEPLSSNEVATCSCLPLVDVPCIPLLHNLPLRPSHRRALAAACRASTPRSATLLRGHISQLNRDA
jgi:hypothetical protein